MLKSMRAISADKWEAEMLKISIQQDNSFKRPSLFRLLLKKDDITMNLVKT